MTNHVEREGNRCMEKPNRNLCPKRFCFHWREAGTREAPGFYSDLEHALAALEPVTHSGCGLSIEGECIRVRGKPGALDHYEPHEPELEAAGYPWFYFVPSPENITDAKREEYIRESEALWGPRHWLA